MARSVSGMCLGGLLLAGSSCATMGGTLKPQQVPYEASRFVILTADDFGASENINRGIRLAAEAGVITAVSAMTNFSDSLPALQDLARDLPQVGIGVHLNITTGKPVLPPERIPSLVTGEGTFHTIERILPRLPKISRSELKQELKAQIEALRQCGIRADHLSNQHGLLSLYSPFFQVVLELAAEYDLPVRSCIAGSVLYPDRFPQAGTKKKSRSVAAAFALGHPLAALSFLKYPTLKEMIRNEQRMAALGVPHPDLLLDSFYGDPTPANVLHILENLPPGISEIVLHLGSYQRDTSYPSGLDLEYFRQRECELVTVTSAYLKDYFRYLGITAIGYRDLPRTR